MTQFSVYLFDFDGTLFDTKISLRKVYRDSFAAVGIFDITDEECAEFMHHSLLQTMQMRNIEPKDYQTFSDVCIRSLDEPETVAANIPFPETIEVLSKLRKQGKRLAAASGNTSKHIHLVLDHHQLDFGFETVVGSDMFRHGKPAPDIFLLAAQKAGADPKKSIVLEDSINGIKAGAAAGCAVIHVPDTIQISPEIRALTKAVVPTLSEVPGLIEEWEKGKES